MDGASKSIARAVLALAWIAGLIWLSRSNVARFLGVTYLVLMLEMVVLHAKHYYPANIYPILIARWSRPQRQRPAATSSGR